MKVDVTVQVKFLDLLKFINSSNDYVLVDKSLKIKKGNKVKIVAKLLWMLFPVVNYKIVKEIHYNLIVKGYRSQTKLVVFK